jgi:hypothetical protein
MHPQNKQTHTHIYTYTRMHVGRINIITKANSSDTHKVNYVVYKVTKQLQNEFGQTKSPVSRPYDIVHTSLPQYISL